MPRSEPTSIGSRSVASVTPDEWDELLDVAYDLRDDLASRWGAATQGDALHEAIRQAENVAA